ncbi:hypothetical protein [Comamonas faecalis]|uniref:hypothetical protein n=1 Tax=Comamonas faecalis TaxID=1387849 RepID=UPI0011AED091
MIDSIGAIVAPRLLQRCPFCGQKKAPAAQVLSEKCISKRMLLNVILFLDWRVVSSAPRVARRGGRRVVLL